jgi:hypothetical protein
MCFCEYELSKVVRATRPPREIKPVFSIFGNQFELFVSEFCATFHPCHFMSGSCPCCLGTINKRHIKNCSAREKCHCFVCYILKCVVSVRSLWRAGFHKTNFNGLTVAYQGETEGVLPKWLADFVQERVKLPFQEFFIELNQWLAKKWFSVAREFINQISNSFLKGDDPDRFTIPEKPTPHDPTTKRTDPTISSTSSANTTGVVHRVAEVAKPRETKKKKMTEVDHRDAVAETMVTMEPRKTKEKEKKKAENKETNHLAGSSPETKCHPDPSPKKDQQDERSDDRTTLESDDRRSFDANANAIATADAWNFTASDDLCFHEVANIQADNDVYKWRKFFGSTKEGVFITDRPYDQIGMSIVQGSEMLLGKGSSSVARSVIIQMAIHSEMMMKKENKDKAKDKAKAKDKDKASNTEDPLWFSFSERVIMKTPIVSKSQPQHHMMIERFLCQLPPPLRHFVAVPFCISNNAVFYRSGTYPKSNITSILGAKKCLFLSVAEFVAIRVKAMLLHIFYMAEKSDRELNKSDNVVFHVCLDGSCLFGNKLGFCGQAIDFDQVTISRDRFLTDMKKENTKAIISRKIEEAFGLPLPTQLLPKKVLKSGTTLDWINKRFRYLFSQHQNDLEEMLKTIFLVNQHYWF